MLKKTIVIAVSGVIMLVGAANIVFAAGEAVTTASESPAIESSVETVTSAEPVSPPSPQHFFVGLQPQHKLHIQGYLINALHFAHNSYGYVCWSMRAARRNLQDPLFEQHFQQLDHYIAQTASLAEFASNLTPNPEGLPEIKAELEKLARAVKLMLEENKGQTDAAEPGARVMESGKIHEEVGKAIPGLTSAFQKALQEQASATSQVDSEN